MVKFLKTVFANKPLIVVFAGFLLTLATFLGNILLSVGVAEKLQKNVIKVEKTYQAIVQLEEVVHLLFMVETNLRAYAANPNPDFLQRFKLTQSEFINKSNQVIRRNDSELISLEVLIEFKNLIEERRDFFQKTFEEINSKSESKAILFILFSQSTEKSLDIKALVNDIEKELRLNIDRQRFSVVQNIDYTRYTNFIAITIALVVAIFANISIAQDYLRQKEVESILRQLNDDKTRFFSILGHDLRTPFTSLNGILYLLKNHYDDFSDEEIKQYIDGLEDSAKSYLTLLDDVLTWSRLQMNKVSFNPEPILLKENIEQIVNIYKEQTQAKSLRIEINIDPNLQLIVDKNALNTILRNIFSNAIKFSNKSGLIKIFTQKHKNQVLLSFEDNGVGMAKPIVEKLFTHNTISTLGTANESGTGLGLAISKEFIDRIEASIQVTSKEGEGSTFSISFKA